VFAQADASDILARWHDLAAALAEGFPRATELMQQAREDVLAFGHFPKPQRRKVWSTNLLERANEAIKRRPRRVGTVLLEQDEHWQLEGRRMFWARSMAAIPVLEVLPALQATSA
jgi:transposase-like protein